MPAWTTRTRDTLGRADVRGSAALTKLGVKTVFGKPGTFDNSAAGQESVRDDIGMTRACRGQNLCRATGGAYEIPGFRTIQRSADTTASPLESLPHADGFPKNV